MIAARNALFVVVGLLTAGLALPADGQTTSNLSMSATSVSASANPDDLKLINDNRYATNAKFWSSYESESSLGQYAYVEMGWDSQYIIKEVRARSTPAPSSSLATSTATPATTPQLSTATCRQKALPGRLVPPSFRHGLASRLATPTSTSACSTNARHTTVAFTR